MVKLPEIPETPVKSEFFLSVLIISFSIFCYSFHYNAYDNNYFYQNNNLGIILISNKKIIDDKFITTLKKTKKHFNHFFSTKEFVHINESKIQQLIKIKEFYYTVPYLNYTLKIIPTKNIILNILLLY